MPGKILPKILLLISLFVNAAFGWNYYSGNIVARVLDGDTFDLKNGTRVRLLNVDSPEFGDCGFDEARKRLEELVLNRRVKVTELVYEPFNRDQGLVYQGKKLINEIMIVEGWGYLQYKTSTKNQIMQAAHKEAKDNKRGLYSLGCTVAEAPSQDCNIRGNIDQDLQKKIYYLENCPDYWRVKIDLSRGEKYFCSEEEAQAAGFTKTANCPK